MKVIVGMSGGVDSTIAAYILKKEGHEVIGLYLDFLGEGEKSLNRLSDISKKLDIDIKYKGCTSDFKNTVIKYFVDEYKCGHTPNPCAFCNGVMKFPMLMEGMKKYSCDMMATGHYASIYKEDGRYSITKSKNSQKDQSYMLYTLSQDVLKCLMLPIGDMSKEDVRDIAKDLSLDVAEKKDSQDVCFIKDKINGKTYDYVDFIKEYDFGADYKDKIANGTIKESEIREKPYLKKGEFVDKDGKILGYHEGIINYTIGQRKGLNIAFGERKFVIDINAKENTVVLGENSDLMAKDFAIKDVVWQLYDKNTLIKKHLINNSDNIAGSKIFRFIRGIFNSRLLCKVRYRHIEEPCVISLNDDTISCSFIKDVRAITKGQAAVFYDKLGHTLFGGTIA